MRISLVLLFCFLAVVINANEIKTTSRFGRGVTKVPINKSPYEYLRSVRGKSSCASGTCPFWERHGRSFAALRCYSQEYQQCVCLHRMCFSSCLFNQTVCNKEMVSCLKQICRRCVSVAEQSICNVYDATIERVSQSFSTFACYACCPANSNYNSNNSRPNSNTGTINRPNAIMPPIINEPVQSETPPVGLNVIVNNQQSVNNAPRPPNGVNSQKPPNNVNVPIGNNQQISGMQPANNGNNGRPVNAAPVNVAQNAGVNAVNGGNRIPQASPMVRQTVRKVLTTRRTVTVRNVNKKTTPRTTTPRIQNKARTPINRVKN